jgi:hypothetical protein
MASPRGFVVGFGPHGVERVGIPVAAGCGTGTLQAAAVMSSNGKQITGWDLAAGTAATGIERPQQGHAADVHRLPA